MKKLGRILALVLVLSVLMATSAFAGNITVESMYPEEGAKAVALDNFGVKLTFDSEFSASVLGNSNDKAFTLVGPYKVNKEEVPAYEFPLKVLYSEKNPKEILVLMDKTEAGSIITLLSNEEYTFTVKGSLKDNAGNTLGADKILAFKTLNQDRNNMINTFMMFGMMGAIMFFTIRSTRKQNEKEEAAVPKKEEAFNPYKEAKRTGKSIEQVIAEHQKEVAKAEKKAQKAEKKAVEVEEDDDYIYLEPGHYYVTTKRAVDPEKSKYVKALKEKRAAEKEAERLRKEKYEQSKKKSKKK